MKKTIVLMTAIAALTFTSCSKKEMSNPKTESTSEVNSTNSFKYSESIRVYDATKEFFVDVTVKSNNKDLFNSRCESTRKAEMVLLYSKPSTPVQPSILQNESSGNDHLGPIDQLYSQNNVVIAFGVPNKGDAIGFTLKHDQSDLSNKTSAYVSGFNSVTYFPGWCNSYSVNNYTGGSGFGGDDFYKSGGSYIHYSYKYITGFWIFSGPGYTDRMCILTKAGGWIYADINIYS